MPPTSWELQAWQLKVLQPTNVSIVEGIFVRQPFSIIVSFVVTDTFCFFQMDWSFSPCSLPALGSMNFSCYQLLDICILLISLGVLRRPCCRHGVCQVGHTVTTFENLQFHLYALLFPKTWNYCFSEGCVALYHSSFQFSYSCVRYPNSGCFHFRMFIFDV